MRLTAESIAVGTGIAAPLPPVSFEVAPGAPAVLAVDTDSRPTVLALAASGRMRLDGGRMLVDGTEQPAVLRRATVVVDAPTVSDPSDDIAVRHVVHEELVISGSRARREDVTRLLRLADAADFADAPLGALPGDRRTRLLAECAASRRGVQVLVLTSPERHGGDPTALNDLISALDERGFGVLTLTSAAMKTALDALREPEHGRHLAGVAGPVAAGSSGLAGTGTEPADDAVTRPLAGVAPAAPERETEGADR